MKTIVLVRHAKSSWRDPRLDDFDRPLNKRGKKNAPFMGQKLKAQSIKPDLVLSSPAKRARKTARTIAKAIDYPRKMIKFDADMYHAGTQYLVELVKSLDDAYHTVMLFGHNPGFTELANRLSKDNSVSNIPTTGIYCIQFDINHWRKVNERQGKFVFFDFPKRYKNE